MKSYIQHHYKFQLYQTVQGNRECFRKLIEWAAAVLETVCNQPILPHAIIVLNASQKDIDDQLWNVDFAIKSVLESLSATVNQNATFA